MTRKLSDETIQKIREESIGGKSKYKIARECGISANTVYNCAKDAPSSKPNVFVATVFVNNC